LTLLSVLVLAGCGAFGYFIGGKKGRATAGLVLGLLLGAIGLVILVFLKPKAVPGDDPVPYAPPPPVMPQVDIASFAWLPDPSGRHELRWWDGKSWTSDVRDHGLRGVDTITSQVVLASMPPPPPQAVH
jgi:hypothetical protein